MKPARLIFVFRLVGVLLSVSCAWAATRTVNVGQGGTNFVDQVSGNSTTAVNLGDTVTWIWASGPHSTTSGACSPGCTADAKWDSGVHAPAFSFSITFDAAQITAFGGGNSFPYFCSIHLASMTGTVLINPIVTTTSDSGAGSLRQAILNFNANSSFTGIAFNIPGAGVHTINLLSALPAMTHPGVLDGTSQPGWAPNNPVIQINGASAGPSANGLSIQGGNTTVEGLVIYGFAQNGIVLQSSGNIIAGNFIGITAAGNAAVANSGDGVLILSNQSNNTIGGTTAATRNVISGNGLAGIQIAGLGTNGNVVEGNFIGTDSTGHNALANSAGGVLIQSGAANNTIGGTSPGAGNVISGNFGDGITINGSGTTGNTVQGNLIGSNALGTNPLGNAQNGIQINSATNNTIGGTTAAARNVISGNSNGSVLITNAGASGNLVEGNYIGTSLTGALQMGNGRGVLVNNGASNNVIGAAVPGGGNVISGNVSDGVSLTGSGTNANLVQGNFIGLNAAGNGALGNSGNGVSVSSNATNNVIGGTTIAARNVISGNVNNGVLLASTTANLVQGNFIGTDSSGNFALGNHMSGVAIASAVGNVIDGAATGTGNVISGNFSDGVSFSGGAGSNNVQGNFIGLNAAGNAALGNQGNGINLSGGAFNNTLGGSASGSGNVISGNGANGILISGSGTNGNQVQGNEIGANANNTGGVGNLGDGVRVDLGAANNSIGASAGNIIAYNGKGVVITGGSATVGNVIESNAIFSNVGLGIDLGDDGVTANDSSGHTGPNNFQNFPVLTSAISSGGTTNVPGTLKSAPNSTFHVELFGNPACDASGHGQGLNLLGSRSVSTDNSGNGAFNITFSTSLIGSGFLSATATDSANNTSEFSACQQADYALTNVTGHNLHVRLGKAFPLVVASFTDTDPSGNASQFTGTTIDWGDGTAPSTATIISTGSQNYNVIGAHAYTKVGAWTVTVTISDSGGATATATSKARLWPKPLSY
ncbi:MAG TPA: hypothetical protein VK699_12550 [Terriglobales bacterium]|jgi:plastocyanin|nr:hypothetical protein [Terriglobales bacterium]